MAAGIFKGTIDDEKAFGKPETLRQLYALSAIMANTEIPEWESINNIVMGGDGTTVDKTASKGEWMLNVAFAGLCVSRLEDNSWHRWFRFQTAAHYWEKIAQDA